MKLNYALHPIRSRQDDTFWPVRGEGVESRLDASGWVVRVIGRITRVGRMRGGLRFDKIGGMRRVGSERRGEEGGVLVGLEGDG